MQDCKRQTHTQPVTSGEATGGMGALQGGPWPTQNFGWVGHNAFGLPNNWPVFYVC